MTNARPSGGQQNGPELPEFDNPPVVETAVGVEFLPLQKWDVPHFGLFWHSLRHKYPHTKVQYIAPGPTGFPVVMIPIQLPVRCQFLTVDETQLIQVQNDRFFYNWQRLTGADAYPHYDSLRPLFEQHWLGFRQFLMTDEVGFPDVQACEVTYVNHIERGQGWETLADLSRVFLNWQQVGGMEALSSPGTVLMDVIYPAAIERGQLRVQIQTALRNTDGREILQMVLTARSKPALSELSDVLACLDSGHETIVRSFAALTSAHMHELWQRKDGAWR